MITHKSHKREIRDLQRLLLSFGFLTWNDTSQKGKWGRETQAAVLMGYSHIGWDHPPKGRWVTAPALAAMASAVHHIAGDAGHSGGGGTHVGGGGTHVGGGGTHVGGGGTHVGGGGDAD